MPTYSACVLAAALSAAMATAPVGAHEAHVCPPGLNDTPALSEHLDQTKVLKMSFPTIFRAGQAIFTTNFNACDGAEGPGTNGGVNPRIPDPLEGPRFTCVSALDASACASCRDQAKAGGAGDLVAKVFVPAQNQIPVSGPSLTRPDTDLARTYLAWDVRLGCDRTARARDDSVSARDQIASHQSGKKSRRAGLG
jgi:hypothetical protein